MKEDSIPICRSVQKHWIYKDAEYFKIWFEMLANARYGCKPKTDMYEGIIYTLKRGEFIFGRKSWSLRLNIGEQKIRTLIKKLIKENMLVEVSRTSKFTIYSITNYENFNPQDNPQDNQQKSNENQGFTQCGNLQDNQQNNQQVTDRQPPSNHQVTTKEESKEGCKKEKNEKENNNIPYQEVYDYYLSLGLIKHKEYTNVMKNAIQSAMKTNKYTIEDCKTLLERHKKVVEITKKNEYPVKARPLIVFFGQKVANAKHLICSEYEEGGTKYEIYLNPKGGNGNGQHSFNSQQNKETGKWAGFKPQTIETDPDYDFNDPDIM